MFPFEVVTGCYAEYLMGSGSRREYLFLSLAISTGRVLCYGMYHLMKITSSTQEDKIVAVKCQYVLPCKFINHHNESDHRTSSHMMKCSNTKDNNDKSVI